MQCPRTFCIYCRYISFLSSEKSSTEFSLYTSFFAFAEMNTTGIGFIADQLILRNCKEEEWVMCKFLKMHGGRTLDFTYFGLMLPDRVTMKAKSNMRLELGNGILFKSNTFQSTLSARHGGDRLVLKANIVLTYTNDVFPGDMTSDLDRRETPGGIGVKHLLGYLHMKKFEAL